MTKRILISVLASLSVLAVSAGWGQEWTRFRGPNGQGISDAKDIPVKWTEKDYDWKTALPGKGHSSPVVRGERVFLTCSDKENFRGILVALRISDGEILWRKTQQLSDFHLHKLNDLATGTPTVDADRVYTIWHDKDKTIVVAFDHAGEKAWEKTFPAVHTMHGPGITPIVVNDMVVFTLEQEKDVESAWYALDCRTGEVRWKCDRESSVVLETGANAKPVANSSYSTPCLYKPKSGPEQLVFNSFAHGITGVDPGTGKVLWERKSALPFRVVASPVIAGDLVIASAGTGKTGKRLSAVRPDKLDESGQPEEVYVKGQEPVTPYVPTPLAKDGLLFTFHDQGDVSCLDAATGEEIWREKIGGRTYGSPVWVDGKLYCVTIDGTVIVLRAGREYELLAMNGLGEESHATPAIADGRMLLRTFSHLISIGGNRK